MNTYYDVKNFMDTLSDYSNGKYKKTKDFNQTYRIKTGIIQEDKPIIVDGSETGTTVKTVLGKYAVKINAFDNDEDILYLSPIDQSLSFNEGQEVVLAYWGDLSSAKIIGLND